MNWLPASGSEAASSVYSQVSSSAAAEATPKVAPSCQLPDTLTGQLVKNARNELPTPSATDVRGCPWNIQ